MATKYYNNLYEIEDPYRRKKYNALLLTSLKNDMNKWSEHISQTRTKYSSPDYNGISFNIAILSYSTIAYVWHNTPVIPDRQSELISDSFNSDLKNEFEKLRENIFTPEIYELEKLVGNKHSRKEKLESIEIEYLKEVVEDTYQDWLKSETEITAKMVAKIIYSYRKNEDIYNLWMEKFKDINLIIKELNKLK